MKLTIERAALLKALSHVQSVVERRTTIPILSNVLLQAAAGKLALSASAIVPGPALVMITSAACIKSGISRVKP